MRSVYGLEDLQRRIHIMEEKQVLQQSQTRQSVCEARL